MTSYDEMLIQAYSRGARIGRVSGSPRLGLVFARRYETLWPRELPLRALESGALMIGRVLSGVRWLRIAVSIWLIMHRSRM